MSENNQEIKKQVDVRKSYIDDNIELQKKLYDMLVDDKFSVSEWVNEFIKYEKQYSRFFYSYITQYIFAEVNDGRIEQLFGNWDKIMGTVYAKTAEKHAETFPKSSTSHGSCYDNKKIKVSHNQYLMISKLYDHCNLANRQRITYKATKEDIELSIKKARQSTITESEGRIESKIKEYEKSITSQLIGLISIFTALSFLLFGGISSFGNIFTIVRTVPLGKLLIILDIWFICMFNLFALFIQMIAMVTDKQFKIKMYLLIVNVILVTTLFVLTVLHILKTILPPFLL